jgi:hypothetical protein
MMAILFEWLRGDAADNTAFNTSFTYAVRHPNRENETSSTAPAPHDNTN